MHLESKHPTIHDPKGHLTPSPPLPLSAGHFVAKGLLSGLACWLDCFCEAISCNNYPFSRPSHSPPPSPRSARSPHIIYLGSHIARTRAVSRVSWGGGARDLCTRAGALPLCTRLIKPLARAPAVIKAKALLVAGGAVRGKFGS